MAIVPHSFQPQILPMLKSDTGTLAGSKDFTRTHQQRQWNRNSWSVDAHDQRAQQPESRTTADRRGNNSLTSDRNAPIIAVEKKNNHSGACCFRRRPETSRPYRLMKISSMQPKRRCSHHKWPHLKTNVNILLAKSYSHFLNGTMERHAFI